MDVGLVLAAHADVAWDKYNQTSTFPPAASSLLTNTAWAAHGAPAEYTDVRAYVERMPCIAPLGYQPRPATSAFAV